MGSLITKDFSYPSVLNGRTDIPWNCLFGQLSWATSSLSYLEYSLFLIPDLPPFCLLDNLGRKGRTQHFCISKCPCSERMQLPAQCKAGGAEQPWSAQCPSCLGSCPGMSPPRAEHRATDPQQKTVTNQSLQSPHLQRTVWNTAEQHLEPQLQQSLHWNWAVFNFQNNPDGSSSLAEQRLISDLSDTFPLKCLQGKTLHASRTHLLARGA